MNEQTIDFNATLKIQTNALSVDMDGDVVAMNLDDDQFYGINNIGSLVWRLIEVQEMTVAELYGLLTEHFKEDDPEQIKLELISFLKHCQDSGMLSIE